MERITEKMVLRTTFGKYEMSLCKEVLGSSSIIDAKKAERYLTKRYPQFKMDGYWYDVRNTNDKAWMWSIPTGWKGLSLSVVIHSNGQALLGFGTDQTKAGIELYGRIYDNCMNLDPIVKELIPHMRSAIIDLSAKELIDGKFVNILGE